LDRVPTRYGALSKSLPHLIFNPALLDVRTLSTAYARHWWQY